jgi:hypothetical protein
MYVVKHASIHIIVISFLVFVFLNLIENLIHYNIGRFTDDTRDFIKLSNPPQRDWFKIVVIMIIFGLLQGYLTYYLNYIF